MFSIVPSCALAEEETAQPSFPEDDFDTMQSRMIESVDRMIVALENSTEGLDTDTLQSTEEMINGLTSIKEEVSEAETESDLQTIREKLDTLLEEAPDELKSISGFGMGSAGHAQNGSKAPPRDYGNMSEGSPEMPQGANLMGDNASMEKQGMPGKAPGEQEEADIAEDSNTEASTDAGFFRKLINSLKSLFS
ncbi:hypothetical protein [Methanosarcina sp. DH2]|uniref:hypothetical protein n=1 Tax=Methanosarcina sp. DH2 TaxID=2605639 RepID=UPI001E52ADE3|nr:hypothetical protein [Methanosarcina sp. DH2]